VGEDTAAFLGFDIPLGKEFLFQTEIDRIFFVKNRTNEILYNFGLKYSVIESFYISLLLMTGYHRPTNRVLEIGYHTNF
jgi:hypothetical protein